ncbi:MAG: hypothetical protein HYW02_05420 [Deltaproteobacteria bacterium]|nr:hypothetical protein [Deltaproteobacteria bacterium]
MDQHGFDYEKQRQPGDRFGCFELKIGGHVEGDLSLFSPTSSVISGNVDGDQGSGVSSTSRPYRPQNLFNSFKLSAGPMLRFRSDPKASVKVFGLDLTVRRQTIAPTNAPDHNGSTGDETAFLLQPYWQQEIGSAGFFYRLRGGVGVNLLRFDASEDQKSGALLTGDLPRFQNGVPVVVAANNDLAFAAGGDITVGSYFHKKTNVYWFLGFDALWTASIEGTFVGEDRVDNAVSNYCTMRGQSDCPEASGLSMGWPVTTRLMLGVGYLIGSKNPNAKSK